MDNPKQCFTHFHMTIEEYGLWNHARSLSHESGKFYLSGPKVALEFADTTRNTIYRIGQNLIEKKWFRVIRKRQRNPKTGLWNPTIVYPLTHAEWVSENSNIMCIPCPKSSMDESESTPDSRPSMPVSSTSMPVLKASMPENGNKSDIESESKSERESERKNKPKQQQPHTHPSSKNKFGQMTTNICARLVRELDIASNPYLENKVLAVLSNGYDPKDIFQVAVNTPFESNDRMKWKTMADNLEVGLQALIDGRLEEVRKQAQYDELCRREQEKAAREQKERDEAAAREQQLMEATLPQG